MTEKSADYYHLGLPEIDEKFNKVPAGSNILIYGPPEAGKDCILRRILLHGILNGEKAILVTATTSGTLECEWAQKKGVKKEDITFIDSASSMILENVQSRENIEIVPSPADITVMNVKIAQTMEKYLKGDQNRKIRLGINSISTFLMYNSPQVVYRFLHSLTGRVRAAKMLGIYILEEAMHQREVEVMIKQLCDFLIEVKREEEERTLKMRVVKYPYTPSDWVEPRVEEGRLL